MKSLLNEDSMVDPQAEELSLLFVEASFTGTLMLFLAFADSNEDSGQTDTLFSVVLLSSSSAVNAMC